MSNKKSAHKWKVRGEDFRDRTFEYERHAMNFAAEAFVKDQSDIVRVVESGGFAEFLIFADNDGVASLYGDYTDDHKRYLTTRIAHEMALRNVRDAA